MQALTLTQPVTIEGPDFFGRPSSISFMPVDQDGWYWQIDPNCRVPINMDIVQTNRRRITLTSHGYAFHIYEHIGVLRWMGLTRVAIFCPTGWPPYTGEAWTTWQQLKPYTTCDFMKSTLRWRAPHEVSALVLPHERYVHWTGQSHEGNLSLDVTIDYPKLGRLRKRVVINDQSGLPEAESILGTPSQGYPSWLRPIHHIACLVGIGPARHTIVWACDQAASPEAVLEKFIRHRTLDLLGALSLVDHASLPMGHVMSMKGGHALDIEMLRRAT